MFGLSTFKIIAIAALALFIMGLCWRITYLGGEVKEKEAQIRADNATIEQFQDDQKKSATAKQALEDQVAETIADCRAYRAREDRITQVYHGKKPPKEIPVTNSTEVLDNEGSSASVDLLNGILDGLR